MTENRARANAGISAGIGLLFSVLAFIVALGGNGGLALVFLLLALVALAALVYFFRNANRRRDTRWQDELSASNQELDNLFNEQSERIHDGEHGENKG